MEWTTEDDEMLRDAVIKATITCGCLTTVDMGGMDWKFVSKNMTRTCLPRQVAERWKLVKDKTVKGPWSDHEDSLLKALVTKLGAKKWSNIANYVPGRKGKQCRERWLNHLDPTLKKTAWTDEELNILIEAQSQQGNSWSRIAKLIPGRSENAVKNQWNSLMHRHWSSMLKKKDSNCTAAAATTTTATTTNTSNSKAAANQQKKKKPKKVSKNASKNKVVNMTAKQVNNNKTNSTNSSKEKSSTMTMTKTATKTAKVAKNTSTTTTKSKTTKTTTKSAKTTTTKKTSTKSSKKTTTSSNRSHTTTNDNNNSNNNKSRSMSGNSGMSIDTSHPGSGTKRRQRTKMSRTHSPVYVRVPAILSHNADNNGLLRLAYSAFAKSKYLPRIPSAPSLAIMRSRQTMLNESKSGDDSVSYSNKELDLLNNPNCWKKGQNCVLEMTNGFLQDEMQRSRLFSMVRLNTNELETSYANASVRKKSILDHELKMQQQQHQSKKTKLAGSTKIQTQEVASTLKNLQSGISPGGQLSVSVNMMSIANSDIREPSSAAALMMLQHSPTPPNYYNKARNMTMRSSSSITPGVGVSSINTSNHSNNTVRLHQGVTPSLHQLDDDTFPMTTVSPLFRNGMSPAAARFRNHSGFKNRETLGVTTTTSHQQGGENKKKSLKRSAMSPIASRLMQMKDDLQGGNITQEQKIAMKKNLIHDLSVGTNTFGSQVGKTKVPDNFTGMVKGSGSPLPKRVRRPDLSKGKL